MKEKINYKNFLIEIQPDLGYGFWSLIYFRGGVETSSSFFPTEEKVIEKSKEMIEFFLETGTFDGF